MCLLLIAILIIVNDSLGQQGISLIELMRISPTCLATMPKILSEVTRQRAFPKESIELDRVYGCL